MALDFPNAPTNGQIYTVTGSGEQWIYEAATNSWTSKGLVNTTGGLQYKGDIDITAAPPTGATSGSQYSVSPGGTANAGFGPGVTGTVAKGSMLMYTGTGWIETSHAVPDATPLVKGIDTRKWNRTGTVLSPATAGDVVNISAGTAALPGLTPVGDADSGLFSPGPDQVAVSTKGAQQITVDASGRLLVGTSASPSLTSGQYAKIHLVGNTASATGDAPLNLGRGVLAYSGIAANVSLGILQFTDSAGAAHATITGVTDAVTGANDYPGRLTFSTTASGASTPTQRLVIKNNGLFGFFDGTPTFGFGDTAGFQVSSSGAILANVESERCAFFNRRSTDGSVVDFTRSAVTVGSISVTTTATAYNTSSDYRLKENVTPVSDGITRLQQLKPSRFNFITDADKTVDGFIAHEVQTVVPEAVTGKKDAVDADGKPVMQGIDQSKLVPLLTAALQEAVAKIESLEARLTAAGVPW